MQRDEGHPQQIGRFEDWLGGRALAWAGGAAVLSSLAFLLALAMSRGWLDERGRTALAGCASLLLLVVGVVAHERGGRTDAARAASSVGIAGLFFTAVAATQLYGLVPVGFAFGAAVAVGAVAVVLAMRWDAQGIAALGLAGALAAPLLVGAPLEEDATLALVFVVACVAIGLGVAQRWEWLPALTFCLTSLELAGWLSGGQAPGAIHVAVGAFFALHLLAALATEVRSPESPWTGVLLVFNLVIAAGAGCVALAFAGGEPAWFAIGLGATYVAGGLALLPRTAAVLMLGLGTATAGLAATDAFGGWHLTAALAALALVAAARRGAPPVIALLTWSAAVAHAVWIVAPPQALLVGLAAPEGALLSLTAAAAGAAVLARMRPQAREVLEPAAGVIALYAASLLLVTALGDGQAGQLGLSAFWTVAGVAGLVAGLLGQRRTLRLASLALLGVVAAKVFLFDLASLDQLYRVGSFMAFGLLALTGAFAWQRIRAT